MSYKALSALSNETPCVYFQCQIEHPLLYNLSRLVLLLPILFFLKSSEYVMFYSIIFLSRFSYNDLYGRAGDDMIYGNAGNDSLKAV